MPEVLERARLLVRQAVSGGARFVAFPETCLPGYPA
jgi:predicted amidohydrolase